MKSFTSIPPVPFDPFNVTTRKFKVTRTAWTAPARVTTVGPGGTTQKTQVPWACAEGAVRVGCLEGSWVGLGVLTLLRAHWRAVACCRG